MSTEGFGPDSSIEELESQRLFIQTLIASLSDNGSEHVPNLEEFEGPLRQIDHWLSSKRPPSTPPATTMHPPSSAGLPSRSRNALPNWSSGAYLSPSNARFQQPANFPSELNGHGNASHYESRKRSRNSSQSSIINGSSQKSRRTSDSSASLGSGEESSQPSTHGFWGSLGNTEQDRTIGEEIMKKYQRQQKELEERKRQEEEDAKMARQLELEYGLPSAAPGSSRSTTQAYLGRDGRYERPAPSRPVPSVFRGGYYNQMPTPNLGSEPQNLDFLDVARSPGFADTVNQRINNGQDSSVVKQEPHNPPHSFIPNTNTDGDEDFQIISPDQFRANQRSMGRPMSYNNGMPPIIGQNFTQPYAPQNINTPWSSNSVQQMPGSFPTSMGNGFDSAHNDYSQIYGPGPSAFDLDLQDMMSQARYLAQPSQYNGPSFNNGYGMGNGHVHGNSGAAPFFDLDSDPEPTYPGATGMSSEAKLYERLRARGLESTYYDPMKTHEELERLLENIRPDEDLPPELRSGTPNDMAVRLMAHQQLGLGWLKKQEEGNNRGGILADDMGLGKTIQALALMVERKSSDPAVKTTLIVAPVALMRQWAREIRDKIKPERRLSVFTYHGQQKKKTSFSALRKYDIVLTTYGTIAIELKRKRDREYARRANPNTPSPREQFPILGDDSHWYRVILDEAQNIKNKSTKASQGASHLRATYRLCMTGTPMMNNVTELYSLIRFLRVPPYNEEPVFNKEFVRPLKNLNVSPDEKRRVMRRLQAVIKAILLRRTKESKIDGNLILELPPRTTEVKHAIFDEDQKQFYDALQTRTILRFNKYLKANTIGKNYSNILVLLLRLRQACCHPDLIKDHGVPIDGEASTEKMMEMAEKLSEEVVNRIKGADNAFECPICYDATSSPLLFFPCGHDVCTECCGRIIDPTQPHNNGEEGFKPKCPECRNVLNPSEIIRYNVFRRVHMGDLGEDASEDNATDSDSDSGDGESDNSSDVDSQGDLRGFIANDNEVEQDDDDDDDGKVKEASEADGDRIRSENKEQAPEHGKIKAEDSRGKAKDNGSVKGKSKGKGKAKGKEKEKRSLAQLKKEGMRNKAAKRKYMKRLRKNWKPSAKIDKAMEILRDVQANDPREKIIVFSQFTSLLDLLEVPIEDAKWKYNRYQGNMTPKQRNEAVDDFIDKADQRIMLVSLKAGNSGLNLNCASQVIILDPFWNPFVEEQAVDRAHRIGQMRPVSVHRILVEGTVEDRICDLQEKKRELIGQALDENASRNLSRLGRRELAYLFGVGQAPDTSAVAAGGGSD